MDDSDLAVTDADRQRAMRPVARDWLRTWLRTADGGAFDRLGLDRIRDSADAIARLAGAEDTASAAQVLTEIETLAATLDAPPPSPRRRWLLRPTPVAQPALSADGVAPLVAPLIERLDQQRDAVARRLIVLQSHRTRLIETDRALDDTAALIAALAPALDAAARELRAQDPARAALLGRHADQTLPERTRAVLTQLTIHRQAILTIDLLLANQTVLATALDQARTATLSALQVAIAARRATGEADALARQGEALARTAEAAAQGDPGTPHARRMLDDAVAQARAAITAIERR